MFHFPWLKKLTTGIMPPHSDCITTYYVVIQSEWGSSNCLGIPWYLILLFAGCQQMSTVWNGRGWASSGKTHTKMDWWHFEVVWQRSERPKTEPKLDSWLSWLAPYTVHAHHMGPEEEEEDAVFSHSAATRDFSCGPVRSRSRPTIIMAEI